MRRRELILSAGAIALGFGSSGQAEGMPRVAIVTGASSRSSSQEVAFEERMRELGYTERRNVTIIFRTAEGHADRFPTVAAEIVSQRPDVIVAVGPEANLRAMQATTATIPIVMVAVDYDPVARGYITSLGHPGGNITGVFAEQIELSAKRLSLLSEMVPRAKRIGVFSDEFAADQLRAVQSEAARLGLALEPLALRNPPYDFAQAVTSLREHGADAALVLTSPVFFRQREALAKSLLNARLPSSFGLRQWAEDGGLMSYGASLVDMRRRTADYVDKIIKGAKAADLPVEQPSKFELVVNLKTAKAIGVLIPPLIIARADEIIE